MRNCKFLGEPTTIGELKQIISNYSDDTDFGFRNQPIQGLFDISFGDESFVAFQHYIGADSPISNAYDDVNSKKMEIIIKPRKFIGCTSWQTKLNGVILVEKEEDIDPLWQLLIKQDIHWINYKHVIRIAPKEIHSECDIEKMCVYVGKTDIYSPEELQDKIPFIMYQEFLRI